MKSIMQTKKECYICRELVGTEMSLPDTGLEMHHIFGGDGKQKAIREVRFKGLAMPQPPQRAALRCTLL
nr:MAG TPA: Recombination enhancement function protein nuclease, DNase, HYDROLASE.4A [Caudoviricetes sp.]